jgi:hypothetical protein
MVKKIIHSDVSVGYLAVNLPAGENPLLSFRHTFSPLIPL